jgi:hypothetical protein
MELSPEFKKMMAEGKALDGPKKRVTMRLIDGESAGMSDAARANMQALKHSLGKLTPAPVQGKKVKHVFIEATFPELKGGASRQSAHGEASGTKPAIARAFKNLLKTIPKKRISVISAKISITTKIVEG